MHDIHEWLKNNSSTISYSKQTFVIDKNDIVSSASLGFKRRLYPHQ